MPQPKINLTFDWSLGMFSIFLDNVYVGKVTEATNTKANQQVFSPKVVTDLTLFYHFSKSFTLSVGLNNLLVIYPGENTVANQGPDQFLNSHRSQQFGFNGR